MPDHNVLGSFDDRDVIATKLIITNTGDGLSASMKLDPALLHLGQEVTFAVRGIVGKVRFEPVGDKDGDPDSQVVRVQIVKAGAVKIISSDLVDTELAEHVKRLERQADLERGQSRLPTTEELQDAHGEGEHDDAPTPDCPECEQRFSDDHEQGNHADGLVDGCERCDEERALMAEEVVAATAAYLAADPELDTPKPKRTRKPKA